MFLTFRFFGVKILRERQSLTYVNQNGHSVCRSESSVSLRFRFKSTVTTTRLHKVVHTNIVDLRYKVENRGVKHTTSVDTTNFVKGRETYHRDHHTGEVRTSLEDQGRESRETGKRSWIKGHHIWKEVLYITKNRGRDLVLVYVYLVLYFRIFVFMKTTP